MTLMVVMVVILVVLVVVVDGSGGGGHSGDGGGGGLSYDPWTMESGYQDTQDEDHRACDLAGRYVH